MEVTSELTPLMKQFQELKSQVPDALLFFRMGDFYELFGDDAIEASKILEITLTSREKNKTNPLPMAGFPHHSSQSYIQKLLDCGKKVAIGEQVEDPEEAKKRGAKSIVRREIVRILTPAVQFDTEGSKTHFLATAIRVQAKTGAPRFTLALLDASTGDVRLSLPLEEKALLEELMSLPIKHFLRVAHTLPETCAEYLISRSDILFEEIPSNRLSLSQAQTLVNEQYKIASLEAFLEAGSDLDSATGSLGMLLSYLERTQKAKNFSHIRLPHALHTQRVMQLGPRSAEHLDLLPLFDRINHTRCAMGSRLLKRWILEPLRTPNEIQNRQASVQELAKDTSSNEKLQGVLKEVYDLDRILARINTGLASPRDTYALGKSLYSLNGFSSMLTRFQSKRLIELKEKLRTLSEQTTTLSSKIMRTQKEDAPFVARDGGVFQRGTHPDLDHLIDLNENGQKWLIDLEQSEREKTGITTLKVRYNRVFGYYLEVTSAHLKNVPAHYQRKQTTVGGERFFTEELKKFEDEIISADGKQKALEQQLFKELIEEIQKHAKSISEAAETLAEIDALTSLSRLAWETGWSFPTLDHSMDMKIENGRHPLVDQGRGNFIPNDLNLDSQTTSSLLITGPNMGGKSTVMRQVALIVILGQMGAPVPATRASWGVVSSLYTRIGAHDAIARGQSTFMVEMTELAHILHHADSRSLIVLDEIGRGTSTYDGISVAWASLEWISSKLGCRTLFATHYHELTKLPQFLPKLTNAHMGVENIKGGLRFLYKLKDGPANESFGIQVAKLAGLPQPVIQRAWKVLSELETGATHGVPQMSLFDLSKPGATAELFKPDESEESPTDSSSSVQFALLSELQALDLNSLTPLQAMSELDRLQKLIQLS